MRYTSRNLLLSIPPQEISKPPDVMSGRTWRGYPTGATTFPSHLMLVRLVGDTYLQEGDTPELCDKTHVLGAQRPRHLVGVNNDYDRKKKEVGPEKEHIRKVFLQYLQNSCSSPSLISQPPKAKEAEQMGPSEIHHSGNAGSLALIPCRQHGASGNKKSTFQYLLAYSVMRLSSEVDLRYKITP